MKDLIGIIFLMSGVNYLLWILLDVYEGRREMLIRATGLEIVIVAICVGCYMAGGK